MCLDYVTRWSEKLRFVKKNGSEKNLWEISKYKHTFLLPEKNFMLLILCQILNKYNCKVLFEH